MSPTRRVTGVNAVVCPESETGTPLTSKPGKLLLSYSGPNKPERRENFILRHPIISLWIVFRVLVIAVAINDKLNGPLRHSAAKYGLTSLRFATGRKAGKLGRAVLHNPSDTPFCMPPESRTSRSFSARARGENGFSRKLTSPVRMP